jgi:hypothetical protein
MFADIIGQVCSFVQFRLAIAVAQPSEPISGVLNIPIFHPQLRHGLEVMQCGPWPKRRDWGVRPLFVPRPARVCPYCLLHELIFVRNKILDGLLAGRESPDVVSLVAIYQLQHVVRLAFFVRRKLLATAFQRRTSRGDDANIPIADKTGPLPIGQFGPRNIR